MQKNQLVIAFLLGALVALGAALVMTSAHSGLPSAYAQSNSNADMIAVAGNGDQGKSADTLFIIDTKAARLAIYRYQNQQLSLSAIRNIGYELKLEEWSKTGQTPAVKDIKDAIANNTAPPKK